MGNTNPWAATNRRASLLSLDKLQAASRKQQATSFKLRQSVIYAPDTGMVIWSRAARELVSTIRSKPCEACIRGEAGGSSQQQKGKICQDLHLSLMIKNLKWRTLLTNMVSLTTRCQWPTMHSPMQVQCLKELGLVLPMAAQPTLGSGAEETSSINITAPVQLGPSSCIPSRSHKLQATSYKPQAPSCSRCKRQASSVEQQASSFKPQAASSRTLCPS